MLSRTITQNDLDLPFVGGILLADCSIRKAVRIIIFRDDGKIPVIKAGKDLFYMIPGGGMNDGETKEESAHREVREEVGLEITELEYLGEVVEERVWNKQISHTYAFRAKISKELDGLSLDEDEQDEGHEVVWMDLQEAIDKMTDGYNQSKNQQGRSVSLRETIILEYVKSL